MDVRILNAYNQTPLIERVNVLPYEVSVDEIADRVHREVERVDFLKPTLMRALGLSQDRSGFELHNLVRCKDRKYFLKDFIGGKQKPMIKVEGDKIYFQPLIGVESSLSASGDLVHRSEDQCRVLSPYSPKGWKEIYAQEGQTVHPYIYFCDILEKQFGIIYEPVFFFLDMYAPTSKQGVHLIFTDRPKEVWDSRKRCMIHKGVSSSMTKEKFKFTVSKDLDVFRSSGWSTFVSLPADYLSMSLEGSEILVSGVLQEYAFRKELRKKALSF